MVVSLKTDLRFPIPGQQGHGDRIIHSYDGNIAGDSVTPDTAYANAGLPYGPMPKKRHQEK